MAEYLIPNYKLEELTKKINRIRNKGAQITFEILENNVSVPAPELGQDVVISCTKVEVEGTYIINGWRFVATIEHASPENIIRVADTSMSGRIPERYWTASRDCEHCHIRRDRNDTYLVYNEEHDEWKQVGRTCLQSYTSGLNAETCADFASVMAEIFRLSNQTNEGNFDSSMPGFSSYISYSMPRVRKLAYKYVAEHGYTSGTTGRQFNDALTNHQLTSEATDEEIQEVTTWLDAAAIGNDWARNARNVWNKSNYELRDAGLITSAVSVYLRNRERELARNARLSDEHNSFAGQVGDKVSFTVRTCVVAYYREPSNYYAHSYPVYRMLGADGRIYMWGSSAGVEPVAGDTVEGRIKKVSENRSGERVTELTRCKIISHQSNNTENSESEQNHNIRSIFSLGEAMTEDVKLNETVLPKAYGSSPDELLAHFTDTLHDLISIYNSGTLQPKYGHDFISFEDDVGRISYRYATKNLSKRNQNKYKFGLVFNTEDIKKSLEKQHLKPLEPWLDIYEKMQKSATGIRIKGIYKVKGDAAGDVFFLDCISEDFRTLSLIKDNGAFDKICQRIQEMNKYKWSGQENAFISGISKTALEDIDNYNKVYKKDFVAIPTQCYYYGGDGYTTLSLSCAPDAKEQNDKWNNYVSIKSNPDFDTWLSARKELLEGKIKDFANLIFTESSKIANDSNGKAWFWRNCLLPKVNSWELQYDDYKHNVDGSWLAKVLCNCLDSTSLWEAWNTSFTNLLTKVHTPRNLAPDVVRKIVEEITKPEGPWATLRHTLNIYFNCKGRLFGKNSGFKGKINNYNDFIAYEREVFNKNSGSTRHILPLFIDNSEMVQVQDTDGKILSSINDSDFNEAEWRIPGLEKNQDFKFGKEQILCIIFPAQYKKYWEEFKKGNRSELMSGNEKRQKSYDALWDFFTKISADGIAIDWIENLYKNKELLANTDDEVFDYTDQYK